MIRTTLDAKVDWIAKYPCKLMNIVLYRQNQLNRCFLKNIRLFNINSKCLIYPLGYL